MRLSCCPPSVAYRHFDDDAVGLAMCEVEKNGRMYEHAADVARGRNGSHRGRPPERGLVFWRPDPYALGLESGYWRALAGSARAAGSCEREQLRLGLLAQWCGSAVRRQLDRGSKYVPCFRPAISAAQRRPELGQRLRQLEPRRRSIQDLDRFPQQPEPFLAAFHESRGAKRPSERARRAPDACELEFLTCESARLLPVAQLE